MAGDLQEKSLGAVIASNWKRVFQKARRAVVYLDGPMAECLQWNGGIGQLYSAGASAVQAFTSDPPHHPNAKKVSKAYLDCDESERERDWL
jgi:hypothetical protein